VRFLWTHDVHVKLDFITGQDLVTHFHDEFAIHFDTAFTDEDFGGSSTTYAATGEILVESFGFLVKLWSVARFSIS